MAKFKHTLSTKIKQYRSHDEAIQRNVTSI